MIHVKGNITSVIHGIIMHQVNCRGVMGAGLARQIRNRWPIVYSDYLDAFRNKQLRLGEVIYTHIDDGLMVASLCAQDDYGRVEGHVFTDYGSLRTCIHKTEEWRKVLKTRAFIPFGMGCGLAGGNWSYVKEIIREEMPKAIIMEYEGK